jgi:maleamate amidohydrolase
MPRMTLLVIDMLNDFFRHHAHLAEQRRCLVFSINTLAEAFRHHDQPVIWIRQEFAPDLSDAFLEMRKNNLRVTIAGTEGCQILPELDHRPTDKTIVKKRYSAFFGTELDETLRLCRTSWWSRGSIPMRASALPSLTPISETMRLCWRPSA